MIKFHRRINAAHRTQIDAFAYQSADIFKTPALLGGFVCRVDGLAECFWQISPFEEITWLSQINVVAIVYGDHFVQFICGDVVPPHDTLGDICTDRFLQMDAVVSARWEGKVSHALAAKRDST